MIARALFAGALLALVPFTALADSPPTGNSVFQVVMEDASGGDGRGVFGLTTGPDHPLGAGAELLALRAGDDAFASYLTIRSYSTGTDYVQTSALPGSANPVVPLDAYAFVSPVPGGYRATYEVPGSSPAAEALTVTFDLTVTGDGPDSAVNLAASVTNENTYPIAIGVRFLLDISTPGDDGPMVAGGSSVTGESGLVPLPESVAFPSAGAPGISVIAASPDPGAITLAHWNRAFESAFDVTPDGSDVTSAGGLNDSALLYYFGATQAEAITVAPGATATFALAMAQPVREICNNGGDDDLDTLADAADPDCAVTPTASAPPATPQPTEAGESPTLVPPPTRGPSALPSAGGFLGVDSGALSLALIAGVIMVGLAIGVVWRVRRSGGAPGG